MTTRKDSIDRDFCSQKLDSVINLVKRLKDDDYPHNDSKIALEKVLKFYEDERSLLRSLDVTASSSTVSEFCRRINVDIVALKPFLGLLLRSSNLRNAFEIYFPIKVLASDLLGDRAKVILSSEWEFSPFTYPSALPQLPEFVFIGIPSSECHNPLVSPLAAHELGHVVWNREGAKAEVDPLIRTAVLDLYKQKWAEVQHHYGPTLDVGKIETDLFVRRIWAWSYELAQRQVEEVFCDTLGVYVFGASFLHSFRYLVAPSLGEYRSVKYPHPKRRAEFMCLAAEKYGLPKEVGFSDAFSAQDLPIGLADRLRVEIADAATEKIRPILTNVVEKYKGNAEHFADHSAEEDRTAASLRNLVPCATVDSVSAIVNAAWTIRLDIDGWKVLEAWKNVRERRSEKIRILRDLTLKSFEIYEYRRRLTNAAKRKKAS